MRKFSSRILVSAVVIGFLAVSFIHIRELTRGIAIAEGPYAWKGKTRLLYFGISCFENAAELPANFRYLKKPEYLHRLAGRTTAYDFFYSPLYSKLLSSYFPNDSGIGRSITSSLNNQTISLEKHCQKKKLSVSKQFLHDPLINALSRWTLDQNGFTLHEINKAEELIRTPGTFLNAQDSFGHTPLMLTLIYGRPDLAEELILKGADISLKDNMGRTCVHYAAKYRNVKLLKLLFSKGADLNSPDNASYTPLIYATAIFVATSDWTLPSYTAEVIGDTGGCISDEKSFKTASFLIENNVNTDICGKDGFTALTHAYSWDFFRTARMLKRNKAALGCDNKKEKTTVECENDFIYRNFSDKKNMHKLVFWRDNSEMIEKYRKTDDFNQIDEDGYTPLYTAFLGLGQREGVLNYLLDHKAVMPDNGSGYTALMAACEWNAPGIVSRLINEGADINLRDSSGKSALDYAEISNNQEIIGLLKKAGAVE